VGRMGAVGQGVGGSDPVGFSADRVGHSPRAFATISSWMLAGAGS